MQLNCSDIQSTHFDIFITQDTVPGPDIHISETPYMHAELLPQGQSTLSMILGHHSEYEYASLAQPAVMAALLIRIIMWLRPRLWKHRDGVGGKEISRFVYLSTIHKHFTTFYMIQLHCGAVLSQTSR